jgi:hypothetical protein
VPDVSFILTKFGLPRRIFVKVPNVKFNENPSSGSLYTTSGQTDMLNDMTKLISYLDTTEMDVKIQEEILGGDPNWWPRKERKLILENW